VSWLARIELDGDMVARLRIADSYDWHRRLWGCFPDEPNKKRDFLTRVDFLEGSVRAWLLAEHRVVCPDWCPREAFAVREVAAGFLSHRYYAFDLRANPTKALVQREPDGSPKLKSNGKRTSGKRVPLVSNQDLRSWIDRKGRDGGFLISEARPLDIGPMVESYFRKKEAAAYHGGVQFRGVLEVTEPSLFAETYKKGIGAAKSFGFGLFLLAPIDIKGEENEAS
jgi:CRISPR system Cascade subunit CasE